MSKADPNHSTEIATGVLQTAHSPLRLVAGNENIAPEPIQWTREKIARTFAPSVNALPFVEQLPDGNVISWQRNYWIDQPTTNSTADFQRGKAYAALTVDALQADGCGPLILEHVFASIVADAVARRAKGGRYSRRQLTPAADGFLHGLARYVTSTTRAA
jgi:hypothetical protein